MGGLLAGGVGGGGGGGEGKASAVANGMLPSLLPLKLLGPFTISSSSQVCVGTFTL